MSWYLFLNYLREKIQKWIIMADIRGVWHFFDNQKFFPNWLDKFIFALLFTGCFQFTLSLLEVHSEMWTVQLPSPKMYFLWTETKSKYSYSGKIVKQNNDSLYYDMIVLIKYYKAILHTWCYLTKSWGRVNIVPPYNITSSLITSCVFYGLIQVRDKARWCFQKRVFMKFENSYFLTASTQPTIPSVSAVLWITFLFLPLLLFLFSPTHAITPVDLRSKHTYWLSKKNLERLTNYKR